MSQFPNVSSPFGAPMGRSMSRAYSAASLVATYRAARTWDPAAPFLRVDWCTVLTAPEWLQWFRECLHSKINARDPRPRPMGRRWEGSELDALKVREYQRGIRHSGCSGLLRSEGMRRRFPHVNRQPWEA